MNIFINSTFRDTFSVVPSVGNAILINILFKKVIFIFSELPHIFFILRIHAVPIRKYARDTGILQSVNSASDVQHALTPCNYSPSSG
jgi:hypothetical protein